MAKFYIVSRPDTSSRVRYADLLYDTDFELSNKAKALRMRRWRALKRSPKQHHSHLLRRARA